MSWLLQMQMLLLFIYPKQQVLMALIDHREKKERILRLKRNQILIKQYKKVILNSGPHILRTINPCLKELN